MQRTYETARQLEKLEKEDILHFVASNYAFADVADMFINLGYLDEVNRWVDRY